MRRNLPERVVVGLGELRAIGSIAPVATIKLLLHLYNLRLRYGALLLKLRYLRHQLGIAPGGERSDD